MTGEFSMDMEKIMMTAQKISFAFEDLYEDKEIRAMFDALFNKYLSEVDPSGVLVLYDAIVALGRKAPDEFDQMIKEMQEMKLISD
jgi:hypothetical protein